MDVVQRSKMQILPLFLLCGMSSLMWAQTSAEQQLWEDCGALRNTADACACYQRYINTYPEGRWSPEANRRLDQCPTYERLTYRKCETATEIDSIIRHCRDYVEEFPNSRYTAQARQRLDNLDKEFWENITNDRRNDRLLQRYRDYFPDGQHIAEVSSQLDYIEKARTWSPQRLWEEETNGKGVQRLEDFIAFYGDSPLAENARQQIALINARIAESKTVSELPPDERAYARVSSSRNPVALRNFISDYPSSSHAKDVEQRLTELDVEAWQSAQEFNTEAAYRQYAQRFPDGTYISNVDGRIANAKSSAIDEAWTHAITTGSEDAYLDFLENHPASKYETAAQDSLEGVSKIESRKTTTPSGEFVILFYNAVNLQLDSAPDPDSVYVDDSSLASGNILKGIIRKSSAEYIIIVKDENGKSCVVTLNNNPRVVAVIPELPQTNPDTIRIQVSGGSEPYTVEFVDTVTKRREYRSVSFPEDSLFVLADRSFESLDGTFEIVVKDHRRQGTAAVSAGFVKFSRPFYEAYMGILFGGIGLILAVFLWRFIYRKYIRTEEIDPYEGFVEEAFDT